MTVAPHRATLARWLARSLTPEASRELSRASATVRVDRARVLAVHLRAADAGAMRAALNTYLGWVHLALSTARTADGASRTD